MDLQSEELVPRELITKLWTVSRDLKDVSFPLLDTLNKNNESEVEKFAREDQKHSQNAKVDRILTLLHVAYSIAKDERFVVSKDLNELKVTPLLENQEFATLWQGDMFNIYHEEALTTFIRFSKKIGKAFESDLWWTSLMGLDLSPPESLTSRLDDLP